MHGLDKPDFEIEKLDWGSAVVARNTEAGKCKQIRHELGPDRFF